jgi:hypothetical protein
MTVAGIGATGASGPLEHTPNADAQTTHRADDTVGPVAGITRRGDHVYGIAGVVGEGSRWGAVRA